MNGPILNYTYKKHNNRDPLGIDGISQSIVGELCPIINSVTPHVIYWILVNWLYYDLYVNRKTDDLSEKTLNNYIKTINYFIVLGNLLNNVEVNDMVGVTNIKKLDMNLKVYSYDENYIKTITGINYYKAALSSAGFITYTDLEQNNFQHLKFTKKGTKLALSIDNLIKKTNFYKKCILNNNYTNIPANYIKEFGSIISFDLKYLEESKSLIKQYFFGTFDQLSKQYEFIKYLYYDLKIEDISDDGLRIFLYDYFSPRSLNNNYPSKLSNLIKGWEVLTSRHYFTNALEMIFSYVLETLTSVVEINTFIDSLVKDIPEINISEYISKYNLNGNEIHDILSYAKNKKNSHDNNIINAIKILCSLYNRLYDRNDLKVEFLLLNNEGTSISLESMLNDITKYKNKTIKEYSKYIIENYIIKQHIETAKRKMEIDEDSFFFGYYNDVIYNLNNYIYEFRYQNLRINNLYQVINELDMLGER